jgi:hypothetical protein
MRIKGIDLDYIFKRIDFMVIIRWLMIFFLFSVCFSDEREADYREKCYKCGMSYIKRDVPTCPYCKTDKRETEIEECVDKSCISPLANSIIDSIFASLDSSLEESPVKAKEALVISIFPGFLVHGLGHFWIKKYSTFLVLLVFEIISIRYYFFSEKRKEDIKLGHCFFFSSWIADITGVGIHLRKVRIKEKEQEIEVSFIHSW